MVSLELRRTLMKEKLWNWVRSNGAKNNNNKVEFRVTFGGKSHCQRAAMTHSRDRTQDRAGRLDEQCL